MRTKGKFWARFILLLALCAAAVFAWGSVGIVPTFAESGGNGRQGEVSLLALPENVTVAEITSVELTGSATTASSYEQIKEALTVTATGSDGEVYQLGSDEFELIGVFADGAQETNQFRVECGNVQSAATVELSGTPVGNTATRSISAVFTPDESGPLYSNSDVKFDLPDYLAVTRYTWDGSSSVMGVMDYEIDGDLTPTTAVAEGATFDKEITIYEFVGGGERGVSCTVEITGIHPAQPQRVSISGPGYVDAFSTWQDYADTNPFTFTVTYAGGVTGTLSGTLLQSGAVKISYGDASGTPTEGAEGFVYSENGGSLIISYTEAGHTVTGYLRVRVNKVAVDLPTVSSGVYQYEADGEDVTTTEQTVSLNYFREGVMRIQSVAYSGHASGVTPAFNAEKGTFVATEAGDYTVTVELVNPAYYFRGQDESKTEMDIVYTLEPAEPPIGIEWSDSAYEGGELRWNRDDDVSFTLLNNYGGGDVTYTYRKAGGGTTTGSGTEPNLPNEAGTYTLTVRVAASGNFTAVEGKELATFTIGKRVLQAPTLSALTYTGAAQAPAVTYAGENDASYLAVTNNGGTDAGECTATFTIEDADEATWSEEIGGEGYAVSGNTLTITYEIAKLEISAPSFTDPGYTYSGSAQTASLAGWAPSAGLAIETPVTLTISGGASADLASGALTATDAGTYTVTASLGDTANLVWSDGETANKTFTWTIAKKAVDVPTFGSKTYNGTAQTADIAASSLYDIAQGSDWVDADTYTVTLTLTDGDNYKWAGDTNPDGETAAEKELSFTITPLELTISWSDTSFIYDGAAHQPAAEATNDYDRDGIALTVAGAQTNAGGYTATVTQITGAGKDNYTLPADATGEFTISPRVIEVEWGTLTHTYDGEAWNPAATVANLASKNGVPDTVGLTGTVTAQAGSALTDGKAVDVGSYTLTIDKITNANYTIEGASGLSATFSITQREIGISWSNTSLTYNGEEQAPTAEATGVYGRDEIALTVAGGQTNAGDYTAAVTQITGTGAGNYKLPADAAQDFSIARYRLDKPTADMSEFVYSGEAQTYMPEGYEEYPLAEGGKALSIAGNVQTDADEDGYTVTVSIADKTNYAWADGTQGDVTFTFIIEKKAIDLNDILREPEGIDGNTNDNDRLIPYTADNRSHLVIDADAGIYSVYRDTSSGDYGVYNATLTLHDPANYKWTGLKTQVGESSVYDTLAEGGAAVTIRYEITRAQFVIEIVLDADSWTYGENADHQPRISGNISGGEESFRYSTDANGTENVTETMPTDVGTYYVIGYVGEAGSYAAAQSEAVSFTITARTIRVTVSGADATYGEWQEVAIKDADIEGNAADGGGFVYDRVTAGSLRLVYSAAGAQLAGDPHNAGVYTVTADWADGVSIHTANFILDVTGDSFTISKKTIGISWSNTSLTYNGSAQAPAAEATGTVTGDDIVLTVTGAQTDAGVGYTAEVTQITGTGADNYALPANAATDFDIDPYTIAVSIAVSAEDAVYGAFRGDEQVEITYTTPTLHGEDAQIALSYASDAYTDGKFNAGGYTVTATIGNANYTFAGGAATQYSFTIEKYTIGAGDIVWADRTFTYNAKDQNDGAFATTAGVYGDGTLDLTESVAPEAFIDAGSYTFTAGLAEPQQSNYRFADGDFTHEYTIGEAQIGIDIVAKSETYRGSAYAASEVFAGGLNDSYTVSGDTFGVSLDGAIAFEIADNKDAGSYAVTLTFTDPNFIVEGWTGDAGAQSKTFAGAFTIAPALLTPSFTYDGGTYGSANGTTWSVAGLVNNEQPEILKGKVSYAGEDGDVWQDAASPAGSYAVTLTIDNKNYTFTAGETEQTFTAADKLVVEKYTIENVDWAEYDGLVYTGDDLYAEKGGAFASAAGVNDDGTLRLGVSIVGADGTEADFIDAGAYTFTATIGNWSDNYELGVASTHEYTIARAAIKLDGVAGYTGTYDADAHDALAGGFSAETVDGTDAVWTFIVGGSQPDADAEGWAAMPTFTDAGSTTVWYKVSAANHKDVIGSVTVKIEKRAISIAIDGTATYGYAAAETFAGDEHGSYEARVTSGSYADDEDFATLLATGLTVGPMKTNYSAGDPVGEGAYVIYTAFTGKPSNYTVTAVNGLLTVNKRAVTVYINNARSDYNEDIAELTWSVTSGSFYNGQVPFTLAATAKKGDPVSSAGNTYYIYATRDGQFSKNYDITFAGSAQYNGEGAGVYTIGAATVNFNIAFLGTTLEYDGTAKQYTATIIGNEQVTLTPVYAYYDAAAGGYVTLGEGQDHAPVGVGKYRVTFTSEDENYTAASTSNDFEITARAIGVTIEPDADLVYDAQGHPVSLTFTKDGGEAIVDAVWSEGADYTVTYEGADGTVYAASSVAPTDVGSYKVTVRVIDENYAMADAELSFAIEKKALTVTVYVDGESAGTITYGDALDTVAFSVSYSGFADGENESFLTGSANIIYLTDYDGEAYAPGAAAGTVYAVTTESLSSDNYGIRVQAATLTVVKRAVTVTILDQTTTYTGVTAALAQDAFTVDDLYAGDAKGDLHVVLATDGVDAGPHDITATFENENYDVTFAGNGSPSGGDTWGKLTIGQAELTVAVQDAHITYGDALDADELFSVRYSGFVGGEGDEYGSTSSDLAGTISYTTASTVGGAAYAQGDAAGSTYTIEASGLTSSNYTIVFEEGTLTVDKRIVTVASVAPGSAQYNYGAAIGAVVRFRNEYAGAQLAEGADYFVQYKGTPFGTSGWGGSANNFTQNAPTDAGEYFAQIVLTNANYTFVVDDAQTTTSAPYEYNIAKRELDVNWAETVIAYVSGQDSYTNALRMSGLPGGFDAAILELGAVTEIGSGAGAVSVQPAADNNYTVTVTGVNIYSVTVTIRADYTYNYKFDEGAASTITFEVTADVNAIGIVAGADFDWTYGSPADWTSDAGVLGNYFELDLGDARDIVLAYAQGDSADGTDLSYSGALPTDAGTYWLRAYYPGGANAGRTGFVYAQFTIRQAELAVPSLETQESTYNTDVYHGTPLTNKVGGYISGTMTVSSTATLTTSTEDGFTVIVQANAAGEYTVTITLTDDNYVWAGDAADDDAVILTWTVHAAQDNAVTIPDAAGGNSWTYGEPPTELPQATATYGTAAYAYALLPDGFTGDDYTGLTWRGGFPTDAGAYVVRASVAATSDYNGAVAYKQFTILPAEIDVTGVAGYAGTYDGAEHNARTAGSAAAVDSAAVTWQYSLTGTGGWQTAQLTFTDAGEYTVHYKVSAKNHADATGTFTVRIDRKLLGVVVGSDAITYGDALPASYTLEYRGFVGGDTEAAIEGTPAFTVEGYDGAAGEYDVTVAGIAADNYTFEIVKGKLTVNAKEVTVTIGNASSVYGDAASVDGVTWSADDAAFAAAYAEYILLATDADASSDVGDYPVTGSVDGTPAGIGNYKIIFKEGTYTVTAKPVTVTITPNGGVYGNVTGAAAEFADGDIVNGDAVTVTFLYSGTAHDGTVYNNAEQTPAAAGIYTVTAMLAGADAGNYSLAPASAVFIVDRQELSVPAAQSTPYTGEALQATGEAFESNAIYIVMQGDHWVDVNTYTVVLTLVDSNYKWAGLDGTVAAVTVDFTITQAENKFTADPSVTGWAYGAYDGAVNAPTGAQADFGDVIYEYAVRTGDDASAVTEWLPWDEDAAAALPAGDYWLIAVVTAERNWTGAQSAAVGFTVERAALALPALTQEETPYTGDELSNAILHFDAAKMSLAVSDGARAEDGVVYATDGGTYTVTLTLTDLNYRWEGGDTVVLTWTITAAENEITWINFDAEWTYAREPEPETPSAGARFGEPKFAYALLPDGFAGDYADLDWTDVLPTDAGSYVLCAYVEGTDDYAAAADYFEFIIRPAEIDVTGVAGYAGIYDGAEHNARTAGSAAAADGAAVTWQYSLTGTDGWQTAQFTFTDAGEYIVYYKLTAKNHADEIGSFTVTIEKAKLIAAVGSAAIDYGAEAPAFGVAYEGFVGQDTAAVVDETELVIAVTDASGAAYAVGSDAGAYTVAASGLAAENYDISYQSGTLFVRRITATVNITANGGVYGGAIDAAAATPDGLIALDRDNAANVSVVLTYSGTANDGTPYDSTDVPVKAGSYIVTAALEGAKAGNYDLTGTVSVLFVIERAEVDIPDAGSKTYTGAPLTADLAETDRYTVEQGDDWVDAGEYAVVLRLKDGSNYRWQDGRTGAVEVDFAITQAANAITQAPAVAGWVYGAYDAAVNAPTGAEALFGTETIVYEYAVKAGDAASVTEWFAWAGMNDLPAGEYWVRAVVAETDNWTAAVSEAVGFTVTNAGITVTYVEGYTGIYDGAAHNVFVSSDARAADGSAIVWQFRLRETDAWSDTLTWKDATAGTTVYCKLSAENHDDVFTQLTVVIEKAELVVRVGSATIGYGEEAPASFGVSYIGFVGGDGVSALSGRLDFTVLGYTAGAPAGTYTVTASGYHAANYDITYEDGSLYVRANDVTVTIVPGGGVYGETITPATATLHGADGGEVGVILTYTGTANDGTPYDSTDVPVKAGTYTVTATLTNDNFTLTGTTSAAFVIERQTVGVPAAGSKVYTGEPLRSDIRSTDRYTVSQGNNWVDVGEYTVLVTLTDAANYRWDSADTAAAEVIFRITPAENAFIHGPAIEDWIYGDEPNAPTGAEALFGNGSIVYEYASEADGEYSSEVPVDAGSYYVRASVAASGNYAGAVSEAVGFRIHPRPTALPSLEKDSSVYSGETFTNAIVGFDPAKMAITDGSAVSIADGKTVLRAADAGSYTVTIVLSDDNYVWEDGGDSVTLTWTIGKLAIEKPTADEDTFIADGSLLEYVPEGFDPDTMEISGNFAAEAGSHTVRVELRDPANYTWADGTTDPITFTWQVEEEVLSLLWLIILLACIAAIELIVLILGIVRRKKGADGADEDGAAGGTKVASLAALPSLLAVYSPTEVMLCWILGAVVVALFVAILLVFLLPKRGPEEEDGGAADAADAGQYPDGDAPYTEDGTEPAPYDAVEPAPYGEAEPAPYDAAEPAPYGEAEPAPYDAAEPAPYGEAEPAPYDAAEPAPYGEAEPAPYDAAEPAPYDAAEPAEGGDAPSKPE